MLQAAFDESGTHDNSPVTCVAGYIFEHDQAWRFDREWGEALDSYALDHFHMADCAHGVGNFKRLSKPERAALCTKLIGIIKLRARIGIIASACEDVVARYREPDANLSGSSYVICLQWCMAGISSWVAKHGIKEPIALFFENGHHLQKRADEAMRWLQDQAVLREGINYASHSFVDKKRVRSIQAADLLAWEWQKEWRRSIERRSRRLSFDSLIGLTHIHMHLGEAHLQSIVQKATTENPSYHEFLIKEQHFSK